MEYNDFDGIMTQRMWQEWGQEILNEPIDTIFNPPMPVLISWVMNGGYRDYLV